MYAYLSDYIHTNPIQLAYVFKCFRIFLKCNNKIFLMIFALILILFSLSLFCLMPSVWGIKLNPSGKPWAGPSFPFHYSQGQWRPWFQVLPAELCVTKRRRITKWQKEELAGAQSRRQRCRKRGGKGEEWERSRKVEKWRISEQKKKEHWWHRIIIIIIVNDTNNVSQLMQN